ncbi:dihydroxyacetone kinase subunit DhaK, partial [Dolichospermum planctonicum UHCC 0167]|uniref:dihydroxyacetone kinase subunit DhaK n=1 Tax=Dolichospermum planctonicum TaxID=136072 RepID=UPI00158040C2
GVDQEIKNQSKAVLEGRGLYPIIFGQLAEICELEGLQIVRNLIGPYMTSLDMQGCSITLLKLDDEMIRLWDRPVKTPSLRWGV